MEDSTTPTAEAYATVLGNEASPEMRRMLVAHHDAERRTLTAEGLSASVGRRRSKHWANRVYGKLGRLVGERLQFTPFSVHVGSIVLFGGNRHVITWTMRPEVSRALELLGWVDGQRQAVPRAPLAP